MADVGVSLGIDAQELYQELQNVTAKFVQFSQQTTQAGEKAGSGFSGGFKGGLGGIGSNVAGALAGIGLGAEIKSVVEYGAHIQDLSDRFGVGVVNLQKFGNAAEKNGASLESVAKGFRFLEVNQAKALSGNDAMVQSFANLGISVEDLKSLSPEQLMLKLGASSLNAADTVKVLGKSALELRPTLAGLADGTIQFGHAMDSLDIARLKEAEDAFKTLKETTTIFTGTILGGFVSAWQQGINSIISLLQALGTSVAANVAGIGKILHGDLSGGAHDIAEGVRGAVARVQAGAETNKDLAGGAAEERNRRDFGLPPGESEAGESDDQGRPLKKTAGDRADDRQEKDTERDREKLAKIEEERRLGALSFEDRNKEQHAQAKNLLAGSEASYPELGGGEEQKRIDLKLQYYDLVKQIEADEKKHAEEMERAEKNRARELKKEKVDDKPDGLTRGENETGNEFLKRTGRIDARARPATLSEGLETGHVQTGSLIGDRSTDDFHADFAKHVDLGPQHLSIAEKLKQSGAGLGKDVAGNKGDKLDTASDKLGKVADKLDAALHI